MKRAVIINRVVGKEGAELQKLAEGLNLEVAGIVPHDSEIFNLDLHGKPVFKLSGNSVAIKSMYEILDALNIP